MRLLDFIVDFAEAVEESKARNAKNATPKPHYSKRRS
jgi:hypothetical protein